MFVSTIIPTINRPTLSIAVQSVLDQNFDLDDFEVIVVNDSGKPLSESIWMKSSKVRVIDTNRRERSVARNAGAAIALGKYLHFLDDDDILMPDALRAFWELAQREPDADWLYGSWRAVDNDGNCVEEFRPALTGNIFALLVCGEGLPFQGSLVNADTFFRVGAFDPDPRLTGVEDRDVGRRLALVGKVTHTSALVAQVRMGEEGSSTNWRIIAQGDQWGREKALQLVNAFDRLRDSASSHFGRGRVSRAYFASMIWNLKRGNRLIALSRFMTGIAMTGLHIVSSDYWQGLQTRVK